jgi:hypothetical protein
VKRLLAEEVFRHQRVGEMTLGSVGSWCGVLTSSCPWWYRFQFLAPEAIQSSHSGELDGCFKILPGIHGRLVGEGVEGRGQGAGMEHCFCVKER